MKENIFWDKKIGSEEVKQILSNDANPRFFEIASFVLSRTNDVKAVFGTYITKIIFCRNWPQIKSEMRKNKWKDERIIFWDEIYHVVKKELKLRIRKRKPKPVAPEAEAIGATIRKARKGKGWSQKELAKNANVSQQLISFVETGRNNFSFETLKKISTALNLKIEIAPQGESDFNTGGNATITSSSL
jgi:HTH-type transcriptional regulator / antitoxin HipB